MPHFVSNQPVRIFRFVLAVALALLAPSAQAQNAAPAAPNAAPVVQPLTVRPITTEKEWKTDLATVGKVLHATASELWQYFPDRKLDPILVEPRGGPIVLFKRGKQGEYFVRLNTGETYWSQYIYQFAHETCHILCRYREGDESNKWFEESLCELASLFVLRQMADRWEKQPLFGHWKGYEKSMRTYAQDRIKLGALPENTTLAQWRAKHAEALGKNATDRAMNQVVAVALLPLFEKSPEHWAAVWHLNEGDGKKARSFEEYLKNWHDHTPAKHQAFVRSIAAAFEVRIEAGKP